MTVAIEEVTAATDEVRGLLLELDQDLSSSYSDDQQHALSLEELLRPGVHFFLARFKGAAVGCGGVAILDDYAEIKRMYCRPSARGHGVAQALLKEVETVARDAGVAFLRLETGVYQHAAIKFYERNGFSACGPFGPYAKMRPHAIELSAFYEKST